MTRKGRLRRFAGQARAMVGMGLILPLLALAAFAFMAIPSSPVYASSLGTCTWNGSVDTDLSVGDNWTPGNGASCGTGTTAGTATLTGSQIIFPSSIPTTGSSVYSSDSETADDIVLDGSYTLGGTGYTLSLSGTNNTNNVAIDAEVGTSTIATGIDFGNNAVDLEAANGAEVDMTGDISGSQGYVYFGQSGGSGTFMLSGNNASLDDFAFVYDGTIDVLNDNALGTGGIDVLGGADSGVGSGTLALAGGVTVSNDALDAMTGTLESTGTGTATWGGPVPINYRVSDPTATFAAATGSSLDVSGTVSDGGYGTSLVVGKIGGWSGTVELSGSNDGWSGTTTVLYGTLEDGADNAVSQDCALDVASGATLELNGHNQSIEAMTGSGTGIIADSGPAAQLTLSGMAPSYSVDEALTGAESILAFLNPGHTITLAGNNSYSGSTTVQSAGGEGTVALASSSALGNTSGVTVGSASQGFEGTLELDGNVTVPTTVPLTVQDGVLDLAGAAGTTGAWNGTVALAGSMYSSTFAAAPGDTLEVNGVVAGASPKIDVGAEGMTGTVDLTAANTYTNSTTTVAYGTLEVGNDDALGTGSASSNGIIVNGGAALSLDSGISIPAGPFIGSLAGVLEAGGGSATWSQSVDLDNGGGTLAAAAGATLDVTGQVGLGPLTSGTSSLTGTVDLSNGVNDFTGTTVAYGTLQDGAANALPITTTLGVASGATFDLNGNDQTVASLGSSAGTVTNTGSAGSTLTDNEAGTANVSATLTNGTAPLNLVMAGSGTLTLAGSNTYTGSTMVQSGDLRVAGSSALGSSSGVTVGTGATLDLTGGVFVPSSIPITDLAGTLETTDPSGSDTWAGSVTLDSSSGGTLAAGPGSTFAVSGAVSGNGSLTAGGLGMSDTVDFEAANTYTGGTTVEDGTLELGSSSALGSSSGVTVGTGATLDLTGDVSIPSSTAITDLAGTLETTDPSGVDTWAGPITLDSSSGGTLGAGPGSTLAVGGAVSGGGISTGASGLTGTVDLSNGANDFTGTTSVGYGTLQDGAANALPTGTTLDVAPGATFDLNGYDQTVASLGSSAGTITNTGSAGSTLTDNEAGTGNVFATLTNGTAPLNLVMAGSGTLTLAGSNTYTGSTTVQSGDLRVASGGALGSSSGVTVGARATLDLTGGVSIPSSIPITDLAGTLETTDPSGSDTWAGSVTLDSLSRGTLAAGAGSTLAVSGAVAGNGSLAAGGPGMSGTVDFEAANTYAGGTTVEDGTLELGNSSALGSSSWVTVGSGATLDLTGDVSIPSSTAITDLAGTLETTDPSGIDTWTGSIILDNSSGGTLGAGPGSTLAISGAVSGGDLSTGASGLTGTVDLSNGANDFTGTTSVAYGTLQDGVANALPTGTTLNVASGATFDLNGYAQQIAGAGSDAGAITDSGTAADFTVGNLQADDAVGETLSGSMNLVVDGHDHTLTLSGTDTYTGTTTVASGALDVTGSLASAVTASSGATLEGTGTVRGANGGGGVIEPGDVGSHEGTLTSSSGADLSTAGSALTVVIGGTSAGTYGQLAVNSGTVNVAGASLDVSFSSGFTSAAGDTYDILANASGSPITGTFAGLPNGGTMAVDGRTLKISYAGGTSGHDIVLTDSPPVHVSTGGGGGGVTTPTGVSIHVSPTSVQQGQSVTYTATVTAGPGAVGTPTGSVAFTAGSTSLCSASLTGSGGTATGSCTALTAPVGTDTVTGTYSGDSSFAASTGRATLTVTAAVKPTAFTDVPQGYWAYQAIEALSAKGIVGGFPGGTFRPDMAVTRSQFVKMLVLALNLTPGSGKTDFADVRQGSWFAPYVAAAVKAGIVQGLTSTRFAPGETITREQMAVLIARAFKLDKTQSLHFSDGKRIGAWALQAVEEAVAAGYMSGFPNGTFKPLGKTTRAQAVKVLFTALKKMRP